MTDFEDRLGSALRAAGDDAPDAAGLGDRARVRSRARRRRTALVTVGAVVATAAVVGGVAVLGSRAGHGPTDVATEPAASATRVETWRDASVSVPVGWGHGNLSTWCIGGAAAPGPPVVERPGGVVEAIACDPLQGYGVQFLADTSTVFAYTPGEAHRVVGSDSPYPGGAWEGYQQTGNAGVQVVASSREEVQAVLDSFEQVDGVDANGCPSQIGDDWSLPTNPTDDVRVCRYSGDQWLEQSELLTGQDAAAAVAALDAAPQRPSRSCPAPNPEDPEARATIIVQTGDRAAAIRLNWCSGLFAWGTPERDLTPDVLHWVLSPGWSGQVPDGITMGSLRQ